MVSESESRPVRAVGDKKAKEKKIKHNQKIDRRERAARAEPEYDSFSMMRHSGKEQRQR